MKDKRKKGFGIKLPTSFFIFILTTDIHCYILFTIKQGGDFMKIIINKSLMVPIYEQISDQIKKQICEGELKENEPLPSVRSLSKELKISALTVKKAYDSLEEEGFTSTVHGKGSYVKAVETEVVMEEKIKDIENDFEQVILKAKSAGMNNDEIRSIFEMILEE